MNYIMNDIDYMYFSNGNIFREAHFSNGNIHREDGPAFIYYYEDQSIKSIEYYKNGIGHRIYGPSDIYYYTDGSISGTKWYYDNINYSHEVENWLVENNMIWEEMTEYDYDRMWMEVL